MFLRTLVAGLTVVVAFESQADAFLALLFIRLVFRVKVLTFAGDTPLILVEPFSLHNPILAHFFGAPRNEFKIQALTDLAVDLQQLSHFFVVILESMIAKAF